MPAQLDPNPLRTILPWKTTIGAGPNGHTSTLQAVGLDELLDTDEAPYDWLVEGLIERGDRMIFTGLEGGGKSTLLRQIGVQISFGIHPFTNDLFEPLKVLIIDCENSRRQVRRKSDRLRKRAGARARFMFRPDGIDLTIAEDALWLAQQIEQERPDVVVIGPIYKMAGGDPKDEQTAKTVARTLDELRVAHGFAILIEAHTPYAEGSKSKRPERPYGASLWSRWPEFGIYLADDGTLRHWRGQRDERQWPAKLRRGDEWPWEVEIATFIEPEEWDGPTHCMTDVYDFLKSAKGVEYSCNRLHTAMQTLGSKFRRDTVMAAAERLALLGRIEAKTGPRHSRIFTLPEHLALEGGSDVLEF